MSSTSTATRTPRTVGTSRGWSIPSSAARFGAYSGSHTTGLDGHHVRPQAQASPASTIPSQTTGIADTGPAITTAAIPSAFTNRASMRV